MMSPSDFLDRPNYVTYSYEEGISSVLKIIAVASIFALISMIVSFIIGIRKKDCIAILTGNIMVKTIIAFLYQTLNNLTIHLDSLVIVIFIVATSLFFTSPIIIEGLIYEKVLKYKKHSGMTVSVICNISTIIIICLIINTFGFSYEFRRLVNLLV